MAGEQPAKAANANNTPKPFTEVELLEFKVLMEGFLNHPFPLVRVIAELDLRDFVLAHGSIKCEAMARELKRRKGH